MTPPLPRPALPANCPRCGKGRRRGHGWPLVRSGGVVVGEFKPIVRSPQLIVIVIPRSDDSVPPLTGSMTLGGMRSLGARSLDVMCRACNYRTVVNVDSYPDDMLVPSFGARMHCARCGQKGASARPDWSELKGTPRAP